MAELYAISQMTGASFGEVFVVWGVGILVLIIAAVVLKAK